jgi:hypothetical protein
MSRARTGVAATAFVVGVPSSIAAAAGRRRSTWVGPRSGAERIIRDLRELPDLLRVAAGSDHRAFDRPLALRRAGRSTWAHRARRGLRLAAIRIGPDFDAIAHASALTPTRLESIDRDVEAATPQRALQTFGAVALVEGPDVDRVLGVTLVACRSGRSCRAALGRPWRSGRRLRSPCALGAHFRREIAVESELEETPQSPQRSCDPITATMISRSP